jgi:hypothetical protein
MLADLQGQIERITYTNEENGYTIAKVKVYGHRDLVPEPRYSQWLIEQLRSSCPRIL